jgi:hypothetical protein
MTCRLGGLTERLTVLASSAVILLATTSGGCGDREPAQQLPQEAALPGDAIGDASPSQMPPDPARVARLENSLRAIEDGLRESPRDRWDPDYVVQQVGTDPQLLFEWVRENTYWIPYRGVLRGPVGVLNDRLGNSLDRALLLTELLRRAGHSVRLAHGELTAEQATHALPRVLRAATGVAQPVATDDVVGEARVAAAEHDLDASFLRTYAAYAELGRTALSSAQARAREQASRLRELLGAREGGRDLDTALDDTIDHLRDHWWVQREAGGKWVDHDLLAEAASAASLPAAEHFAIDALPTELKHEIVVSVIAKRRTAGPSAESTVIRHAFPVAELAGRRLSLRFWPSAWLPPVEAYENPEQAFRATARDQTAWVVGLRVDRDVVASGSLSATGESLEPESTRGGPFAAFGNRDLTVNRHAPGADSEGSGAELAAVWVEYELRSPGAAPQAIRRVLFDLAGEGSALSDDARLALSLALMREIEILPLACEPAPEFVLHLLGTSLLANRALLASALTEPESSSLLDLARQAVPAPSPLYTLAMTRFASSRFRDRIYIDRPTLLTRHLFPEVIDGKVEWRDVTDIVANEIGVDALAGDPFAIRLEQGVLDTITETMRNGAIAPTLNTSNAFAQRGNDWITLAMADASSLGSLKLPKDAKNRIANDLAAGFLVVAPRKPVALQSQDYVGWWRIDAATGHTLGVDSQGRGVSASEYVAAFSESAIAEFLTCEALHEFYAQVRHGAEFGTGAKASVGECVVGAIAAGFVATLPLLIMHVHAAVVMKSLIRIRPPPGGLLTDELGVPKLAGLKWPERLDRLTPLTAERAGSAVSRQTVDKILAETREMHALLQNRLPDYVAKFQAAAARSEATRQLPLSHPERRQILAAEKQARELMEYMHRSVLQEERLLNYWSSVKPVNDQLAVAIAERDAALGQYTRGMGGGIPVPEHLANTQRLLQAQERVLVLQQQLNNLVPGTSQAAAAAIAAPGTVSSASPMAQSMAGVVGVGGAL